jgi:hypothetical protein|nr:MAG TPA: tail tape measure [Caudoviricetes sp.]
MPNVNTRFTISNEKEYKDAISRIGDSMRVLNSEMRKVESEYIKNADSVDALRAKSDVFSKKIGEQKEKIEITRKALEQATKAQEAANEKFQKAKDVLDKGSDEYKRLAQGVETATKKAQGWQVSLNNAEAALNKMNAELEENNDALEKAGANGTKFQQAMEKIKDSVAKAKEEGTGAKGIFANLKESFSNDEKEAAGLGDAISAVTDALGINLPKGAGGALDALNKVKLGTVAGVAAFAGFVAAITSAEKKLMDITNESASAAKEIKTLASVTGQSAEEVQELQYAGDMIGVSYDRIRDSLKEVTNKMQEAQNGSADTAAAFESLGVNIYNADGSLRNANDVFNETIDALGNVQNRTERDALAMDLMSESAQELNPLIEQGSQALKDYAAEAHEMGYVLDDEAIAALTATDTAQQKLLKTQEAVTKQISAEYAPYMTEALTDTADFIQKIGKAFVDSGVVDKFGSILTSATQILEPLGDLTVAVLPALDAALKPVATTMALIADTTNLLVGLLTLNGDKIRTALGLNISSGQLSNMQQLQYKGALSSGSSYVSGMGYTGTGGYMGADGKWHQNAAGTDNFIGGVTWVGENGPEPVWLPQGSRIGTNQEGRSLSGGDTYNFIVQANEIREIDDFIRRMKDQRRVARMGVT